MSSQAMGPIAMLFPRALFLLLLGLKAWQLLRFLRSRPSAAAPPVGSSEVEAFRSALERRWLGDRPAR